MEDIINASLAGGVMIGTSADIASEPWMSLLIGCLAGIISTISFNKF